MVQFTKRSLCQSVSFETFFLVSPWFIRPFTSKLIKQTLLLLFQLHPAYMRLYFLSCLVKHWGAPPSIQMETPWLNYCLFCHEFLEDVLAAVSSSFVCATGSDTSIMSGYTLHWGGHLPIHMETPCSFNDCHCDPAMQPCLPFFMSFKKDYILWPSNGLDC